MSQQISEIEALIRRTKMPEEWEKLPEYKPHAKLGGYIIEKYLRKAGDIIEVGLEEKTKKQVNALRIALSRVAKNRNIKLAYKYSEDYQRLYIQRLPS